MLSGTIQSIPVLPDEEVRRLVRVDDAMAVIEATYVDYGRRRRMLSDPPAATLPAEPGLAAFKFKGARLPAAGVMGGRLIADAMVEGRERTLDYCWVADAGSGLPIGLVEELWLHRLRTAVTGVVAARHLARRDSRVALIVGAGHIAHHLPEPLRRAFDLDEIRIVSRRKETAEQFAAAHREGGEVRAFDDVADAARGADIVMMISSAARPVLHAGDVPDGGFVCGMGGGAEIARDVLDRADRFVVDEFEYACAIGSVRGWLAEGADKRTLEGRVDADIGEVAAGIKPGRTGQAETVLAVIQGMACCDLALAHLALSRAGLMPAAPSPE